MRRCTRNVSDAVRGRSREKISGRFAGARKHQRHSGEHRAQINLQSAIAADVVERAPDDLRTAPLPRQRPRKTLQAVRDQLRRAGGTRGQQYPFGPAACAPLEAVAHRARIEIGQLGVGGRRGRHLRESLGAQVGGTEDDASRDSVEFQQGDRGAELLAHGEQHGAASERFQATAETGALREVGELEGGLAGVQCARWMVSRPNCRRKPQRCHRVSLATPAFTVVKETGVETCRIPRNFPLPRP